MLIDFALRKSALKRQVLDWQQASIDDSTAKGLIYDAFVAMRLGLPLRFMPHVHQAYFTPQYEEFRPKTLWSLSNAFTTAFKRLAPMKQYQATAKLAGFLADY